MRVIPRSTWGKILLLLASAGGATYLVRAGRQGKDAFVKLMQEDEFLHWLQHDDHPMAQAYRAANPDFDAETVDRDALVASSKDLRKAAAAYMTVTRPGVISKAADHYEKAVNAQLLHLLQNNAAAFLHVVTDGRAEQFIDWLWHDEHPFAIEWRAKTSLAPDSAMRDYPALGMLKLVAAFMKEISVEVAFMDAQVQDTLNSPLSAVEEDDFRNWLWWGPSKEAAVLAFREKYPHLNHNSAPADYPVYKELQGVFAAYINNLAELRRKERAKGGEDHA